MKIYHIGNIIKDLVESKNLTVIQFSQMMELSQTAVYDMYRKEDIHTSVLKKISQLFNVPMSYWFSDERDDYELQEKLPGYGANTFLIDQIKIKDGQIEFLQDQILKYQRDE